MTSMRTNIRGRIAVLEQRARDLAPPGVCEVCGGPKPGWTGAMQVNEDGEPKWGRCAACGLALGPDGKPRCAVPWKPGDLVDCKIWGPDMPLA